MSWYYSENNERRGPVDESTFETLVSAGTISGDTLVWREGFSNLQPYAEIKMALKLKVLRADGSPVGYGIATGRYFSYLISFMPIGIGFLMAAFDEEKRALHDRICDTRVIWE